jgi:catechol 2,3-dioxygenase-like lactoylglutathione lyase family enzyme
MDPRPVIRLHHVMVTVPKGAEAEARAFYCDLLGLREIPKPGSLAGRGGFWLELGDIQLHVGTEDGVDRLATKAHFAYEVENVEAWKRTLREKGFTPLDSVPLPGYARFEFRDPFGNRIELIQRLDNPSA